MNIILLNFSVLTDVRPMIEPFPLEREQMQQYFKNLFYIILTGASHLVGEIEWRTGKFKQYSHDQKEEGI